MKHDNEEAAAGLFTLVLVFLLSSILFVVIGFGIDKFTAMSSVMFSGAAASQMRFETVKYMLTVFRIEPFILLLGIGINYWIVEMRQYTGMADVQTMVIAAVEMITMTLILIAFTLFGGSGIDMMTNWVNNFPVTNPDLSLFMAVQYIAPLFYGIMFLVLIGVLVQFIMTCVQTVDYTQTGYYQ